MNALFDIRIIQDYILAKPEMDEIQKLSETRLNYLFGFFFLLMAIVFAVSTYFYKLIIRRNDYIDQIEDWCETYRYKD